MIDPSSTPEQRAHEYSNARGMKLERMLGRGKDGIVFATSTASAVKAYAIEGPFLREWACYRRFMEANVRDVLGLALPKLRGTDERLLVIEMSIVMPPYLLDFASAYLDYPPDFSEEVLENWRTEKQELFGENWGRVLMLLHVLEEQWGVYMLDIHPGNIAFEPHDKK